MVVRYLKFLQTMVASFVLCIAFPAAALTESVIYSFQGAPDGSSPAAALIADAQGNLYGTTYDGGVARAGTVFKLTPPGANSPNWTESILYRFGSGAPHDGAAPQAALVMDAQGNLYGTTSGGGVSNFGAVFKLSPPVSGSTAWTEKVIYSFTGSPDGAYSIAELVIDAQGNLYGTTDEGGASNFGTVFKLSPPVSGPTTWTESVLHSFTGQPDGAFPEAGLTFDKSGNLYGATEYGGAATCQFNGGCGAVFKLKAPVGSAKNWTESVFYSFLCCTAFAPTSELIIDAKGVLYGTASGTVFKLKKSGQEQALWFPIDPAAIGPSSGLIMGGNGDLFGTTTIGGASSRGLVFKLTAPTPPSKKWAETTYSFTVGGDAAGPRARLVSDASGNLFGTAWYGGQSSCNCGAIFKVTP